MAKRFSKKYGNKGGSFTYLKSEYKLCQDAYQRLMLHPYYNTALRRSSQNWYAFMVTIQVFNTSVYCWGGCG